MNGWERDGWHRWWKDGGGDRRQFVTECGDGEVSWMVWDTICPREWYRREVQVLRTARSVEEAKKAADAVTSDDLWDAAFASVREGIEEASLVLKALQVARYAKETRDGA